MDAEAVLTRTPLPPHLLNPRVPREVEAVCLRLLEKRPEARYPSAVALCEALEALKAGADASWMVPLHGGTPPAATKPWARGLRELAGVGVGLALALGAWWLTSGQEVAPGEPAPEPARAVAAPAQVPPPTAAASSAAPRKDSAPVKQQEKTSGPLGESRPRGRGSVMRNVCLGLTGAALQACLGAQQVPPVRPAPLPQPCPAGAVETMTRTLGLRIGEMTSVEWGDVRGRSVPVREDTPIYVFADWDAGKDYLGRGATHVALPGRTRLSGRLYFGEGRVYGRFTEARTPTGETYTVCLELLDTSDNVGLELRPGSTPGKVLVDPTAQVRVVDRFQ